MSAKSVFTLLGLLAVIWFIPALGLAQPPVDPSTRYQQAVTLLQEAEQLLNASDPEAALIKAKEARALFAALQKDLTDTLAANKLSPIQEAQEAQNKQLADEQFATGEQFEKSADAKLAQSQKLAQEGKKADAEKLKADAAEEFDLSLSHYVKSQIYSLRNQQLILSFLKK